MTTTSAPADARSHADAVRRSHVNAQLDRWCGSVDAGPEHDCVVVVGSHGLTALGFAARLARDPRFVGRVTVAGAPTAEDRRLRAGVSLRGYAADHLLHALDTDLETLVDAITPGRCPVADRQTVCIAGTESDDVSLSRIGAWQNHRGRSSRPIVFGFRNSRTVAAVRELAGDGIVFVPDEPATADEARDLATGTRPLIVDATRSGALVGDGVGSGWGIAAAQVPFADRDIDARGVLQTRTALAPLVRRRGRIDVGYFTPFADHLTPGASWYGIMARPVRHPDEVDARDAELDALVDELYRIGEALGLAPIDPDATLGTAWVPAPRWRAPRPTANGVLDLRSACTPGISAYYADGMTGAAVAGVAAAEAVLRGGDPLAAANAALRPLRRWNRIWWFETVRIPHLTDGLTRLWPSLALSWPHTTSIGRWASAA